MIAALMLVLIAPVSGRDCGTEIVEFGNDAIYAWSQDLDGSACRSWDRDARTVRIDIATRSGGYDAGVASNTMPVRVDEVVGAKSIGCELDVQLSGAGHWWAGPKFVITETPDWQGLPGNWECYIIDSSDLSPAELAVMMKCKFEGQTVVDGATYSHYTKPWETWHQAIAIRQTYRDGGSNDVAAIVKYWREHLGVPNWYLHAPKVGLETTGEITGHWIWSDIQTSDLQPQ